MLLGDNACVSDRGDGRQAKAHGDQWPPALCKTRVAGQQECSNSGKGNEECDELADGQRLIGKDEVGEYRGGERDKCSEQADEPCRRLVVCKGEQYVRNGEVEHGLNEAVPEHRTRWERRPTCEENHDHEHRCNSDP